MSAGKKRVVFYHSAICPRCHLSNILLRRALRERPDIEVTKVEFLTHMDRARKAGVKSIPALVAEGRTLTGIFLTPDGIERFLNALARKAAGVSGRAVRNNR